jgi:membrane protein DedA with SNARE-associated domain
MDWILHSFAQWLNEFPLWAVYTFFFFGVGITGEVVAVPLVYFSLLHIIDIGAAWIIILGGNLIADVVWFYVGHFVSYERLKHIPFIAKRSVFFDGLSKLFASRGIFLLLLSKLIYGTRSIMQVFAGMHHLPVRYFLAVNLIGTTIWGLLLFAIGKAVHDSITRLHVVAHRAELGLAIFIVLIIAGYWIGKYIFKYMAARTTAMKQSASTDVL